MKFIRILIYSFVIMAFLAVAGMGFHAVRPASATMEKVSSPVSPLGQLGKHFQKAREYIEKKVYGEAASEIRDSAAILNNEAGQAAGQAKKTLLQSKKELDGLASEVEKGEVKSVNDVRVSFSQAYDAMAKYYNEKASESWGKKAISEAGSYLSGAATALESAWTWSGRKIQSSTSDAIRRAREMGDKIQKGKKWASAEIAETTDALGRQIDKFRHEDPGPPVKPLKIMALQSQGSADLTTAVSQVAEKTIPAIVQVWVTERREVPNPLLPFEKNPFFGQFFNFQGKAPKKFQERLIGLGSGMIVNPEGYILTNNHVVAGATKIKVLLSNGDEYPAKVVGTDPKTDLGVIKISVGRPLPYVRFGNSDQVAVGQWVVAIGHPRALDESVTQGTISAKHRTGVTNPSGYEDFLQTDTPINPGNSGGPLLTLHGLVIGVNSAIATESGGFEGIGFAIPSNMAVYVANALIRHGKVERGWLGVSIQELTPGLAKSFGLPAPAGALVADVMKGGPAEKAGLERGDVIVEYRGKKIGNAAELRNDVAATPVGKEVKLTVWRDKKSVELKVKIGSLEEMRKRLISSVKERLGVVVGPVTANQASNYGLRAPTGVTVQWVDPKGPLGEVGFEKGDLILAMDKRAIDGVDTFLNIVDHLPSHQKVVLLALDHRSGQTSYVQVETR